MSKYQQKKKSSPLEIEKHLKTSLSDLEKICSLLKQANIPYHPFQEPDYKAVIENVKNELSSISDYLLLPRTQSAEDLRNLTKSTTGEEKVFVPLRVNRLQAFLASCWTIYDQILHQLFILLSPYDKLKNKTEFQNNKTVFKSETLLQQRIAVAVLTSHGWKTALSYCLRNSYLHESGRTISFSNNLPTQGDLFGLTAESWGKIREGIKDFVGTAGAAKVKLDFIKVPEPSEFNSWIGQRDLSAVLDECHAASDHLHGTLLNWASKNLLGEIELLAESKKKRGKK